MPWRNCYARGLILQGLWVPIPQLEKFRWGRQQKIAKHKRTAEQKALKHISSFSQARHRVCYEFCRHQWPTHIHWWHFMTVQHSWNKRQKLRTIPLSWAYSLGTHMLISLSFFLRLLLDVKRHLLSLSACSGRRKTAAEKQLSFRSFLW